MDVAGLDHQLAAVGHGVARIERQIEDRGGELVGVDQRGPDVRRRACGVIWMCSPRVGRSSLAVSSISALMSISRGCSGCLRAKASRCLVRLAPRSAASSISLRDGSELGLVGDGLAENADGAGDDGQDVVEVVRDAAGELADRLHLLRLAELGFGGLLLGHVAADEVISPRRLRPCAGPVQRHRAAVLVDIACLEVALLPAAPRRAHLVAGVLEIVGVDELDGVWPIISAGW